MASIHRENFLKELAMGYDAYTELIKNLEEGNNFYKVLTEVLSWRVAVMEIVYLLRRI